jgi:hypothetical protein
MGQFDGIIQFKSYILPNFAPETRAHFTLDFLAFSSRYRIAGYDEESIPGLCASRRPLATSASQKFAAPGPWTTSRADFGLGTRG